MSSRRFDNEIGLPTKVVAITKNDSTVLNCRSLWIGTAGTLNITDYEGNDHDDFPVLAGLVPIPVQKVRTGGTADDIWGLV